MGNMVKWLCLILLPLVLAQDYCSVCSDHTMCKFTGISPACGANSEGGVSSDEAKEIVNLHNAYRAKIAKGQETRGRPGPQPPAGNMHALVWDNKLAEVAQRWADQCTFQHDQCRNDPRFKVGQNIYWSTGFSNVNWTRAVSSWYNEVKDFNAENAKSFKLDSITGHYTQIAWATTTHIGCARTTYGAAYKLQGHRPREFVLATSPSSNRTAGHNVKRQDEHRFFGGMVETNWPSRPMGGYYQNNGNGGNRQNNPGFFGGATFNPAGAHGAITSSSGLMAGSSGSLYNYWPSRPTGGNYPSYANGGNMQNNPGYFGGATFDPAGAQGAITGSSGGSPGSIGSLTGNRPTGGNFQSNFNGGNMQSNPGYFGGATFDPAGAQGAITGSSGGVSGSIGSLTGNRPTGGNFQSNFNGDNMQSNPGYFGGATFDPAGAQGAITGSSGGVSGSIGSSTGNRPTGGNFQSNFNGGNMQSNPGYFGGATFDPAGAQGAITGSSGGVSGSIGSLTGNRPTGGNFQSNFNGGNMQSNPGYFGGATFDPAGAQGAITGSSGGVSGSIGSLTGNRPTGGNFQNNFNGGNMQSNPGYFGGATFDPAGAQGAITGSSGGISGGAGSNGNHPSRPTGGNFPSNGNGGNSPNYPSSGGNRPNNPNYPGNNAGNHPNNPNYPNYPVGNGGNYPGSNGGNRPNFPNYPNYPIDGNEPMYPDYSGDYNSNFGDYYKSSGQYQFDMPTGSVPMNNDDLVGRDQILICNYGPSGNWQGKPLYKQGEACSHCPSGTTCNDGLCFAS